MKLQEKLEKQAEEAKNTIEGLENDLDVLKQQSVQHKENMQALAEAEEREKNLSSKLTNTIAMKDNEISALRSKLTIAQSAQERQEAIVQRLTKEANELSFAIKESEQSGGDYEAKMNLANQKINSLTAQIITLKSTAESGFHLACMNKIKIVSSASQ